MTLARLPNGLPPVASAKFPLVYEAARDALAKCERVDECKTWADKMAAVASYAKQADDRSLEVAATKIRARAIRRCGELLEEFKQGEKERTANLRSGDKPRGGGVSPTGTSAAQAARAAGMSRDQQKEAQRVARVPKEDFEAAVESDNPPTVTELAEKGKKAAPIVDIKGRDPREFRIATDAIGALGRMAEVCGAIDPKVAVRGALDAERTKMATRAKTVAKWIEALLRELERLS